VHPTTLAANTTIASNRVKYFISMPPPLGLIARQEQRPLIAEHAA